MNPVGWLALIGVCLLSGAVLALIGSAVGWSWIVLAIVGAAAALAVLLIIDRRRYGAVWVGYDWTDDEAEKAAVVVALRAAGVEVELSSHDGAPPLFVRIQHRNIKRLRQILNDMQIPPGAGRP
jgi:hypothetical protein